MTITWWLVSGAGGFLIGSTADSILQFVVAVVGMCLIIVGTLMKVDKNKEEAERGVSNPDVSFGGPNV